MQIGIKGENAWCKSACAFQVDRGCVYLTNDPTAIMLLYNSLMSLDNEESSLWDGPYLMYRTYISEPITLESKAQGPSNFTKIIKPPDCEGVQSIVYGIELFFSKW